MSGKKKRAISSTLPPQHQRSGGVGTAPVSATVPHAAQKLDLNYFIAEGFLEATGESDNILHITPTFSLKF